MKISARTILTVFVTISLLVVAVEAGRALWFGSGTTPEPAFTELTAQPQWTIEEPRANGYFLLLGLAAAPGLDPSEVGHRMWIEAESRVGRGFYVYDQPGRAQLAVDEDATRLLDAWSRPDAAREFRRQADALSADAGRHAVLLDRYGQWLRLRFEDRGYGHPGSTRFAELFTVHRLYVAVGFAVGLDDGIARLERDLAAWRTVLAGAMTLPTKVAAACLVEDDAALLSTLLNHPDLSPAMFRRLSRLARPLDAAERSLRWPIQNEFLVAVRRSDGLPAPAGSAAQEHSTTTKRWLAGLAALPQDAFQQVELARAFGTIARAPVRRQKTLNTYARYYQALIAASESSAGSLPRLQAVAQSARRGFSDTLLSPIETLGLQEPRWEPFLLRLHETDARLRLVTLQATLLGTPDRQPIPIRVAQAGSALFDPFTGLPMLWNPSRRALYSVGQDGRDDEADRALDIAIVLTGPGEPAPSTAHSY